MSIHAIPVLCCEIGQWTAFEAFSTCDGTRMIYIPYDPRNYWYRGAIAYRVRVKLKPLHRERVIVRTKVPVWSDMTYNPKGPWW